MSAQLQWATSLGTTPLATAAFVSLMVTLLLLITVRLGLMFGPKVRTLLQSIPRYSRWQHLLTKERRELTLILICLVAVSVAVMWISTVMEGFTEDSGLRAWDRAFVSAAHANLGPYELIFFKVLTQFAGRAASLILGLGLGAYFVFGKNWRLLILWAGGLIGNAIIVQAIKQYYQRPRPEFLNPFLSEANFSFPSGHAAGAVVMFGLMGYILLTQFPEWPLSRKLVVVTLVVWLGVFIGASRLALGVHYPTDVATGWLVASSWLVILVTADRVVSKSHQLQDLGESEG